MMWSGVPKAARSVARPIRKECVLNLEDGRPARVKQRLSIIEKYDLVMGFSTLFINKGPFTEERTSRNLNTWWTGHMVGEKDGSRRRLASPELCLCDLKCMSMLVGYCLVVNLRSCNVMVCLE